MLKGIDIVVLLKLSEIDSLRVLSKKLAEDLFVSEADIASSLKRCKASGLLHRSDLEKRVNRTGLLEFLIHGFRYVFPIQMGSMTRGVPTSYAAEPLKSQFVQTNEPPPVWPYSEGHVRGLAFTPLHKQVPQAALNDPRLYELLALVDGVRSSRVRERQIAAKELTERLSHHA